MTWTGKKCPACKGYGERYSGARDYDVSCPDCGGTGEEFVYDAIEVTTRLGGTTDQDLRDRMRDEIANGTD